VFERLVTVCAPTSAKHYALRIGSFWFRPPTPQSSRSDPRKRKWPGNPPSHLSTGPSRDEKLLISSPSGSAGELVRQRETSSNLRDVVLRKESEELRDQQGRSISSVARSGVPERLDKLPVNPADPAADPVAEIGRSSIVEKRAHKKSTHLVDNQQVTNMQIDFEG